MQVWVEPSATKDMMDKVEQVRQRRKAEKSLLSLQRRLATTSAEELENSGCQKTYASPRKSECENQRFTRKNHVEQQLSTKVDISSEKEVDCAQQETIDLKSKLQSKEAKIEKMKYEHLTREAALTENELLEEEYKKKLDEANKELSLENDLAGM
ncbi:hypothetical protein ZEAMMB73_Zm00001d051401 [Zea mays]|uniref:Uncharacterized protein n=1 Tax=Zea mays TaxID=4577 RepID=A0A1D6Q6M5_MAIZE|nr:hypothetical protein ZEAMMB73_Zm00001d051401 [Zea mays]